MRWIWLKNIRPDGFQKFELGFWDSVMPPLGNGRRRDLAERSGLCVAAQLFDQFDGFIIQFGHFKVSVGWNTFRLSHLNL